MQTRRRSFTAFLAVAAIALANCVGPQMVLAAHHPAANQVAQKAAEPSHGHANHHLHADGDGHHAPGDAQQDTAKTDSGGSSELAKVCCSTMTCMSSAVMVSAPAVGISTVAAAIAAAPLDDMLRAFNAAAIDPPPRLG